MKVEDLKMMRNSTPKLIKIVQQSSLMIQLLNSAVKSSTVIETQKQEKIAVVALIPSSTAKHMTTEIPDTITKEVKWTPPLYKTTVSLLVALVAR